ncbi:MAG TPA: UbiA family prenyltransferase [Thermoanaerobaculia bacterium]|jgi:1,4-dihydroxy-2-naphthoate octaprenyltransferase
MAADEDDVHLRYSRGIRRDLIDLIRADEWWDYKLVPILSTFYATALVLRVAVTSLWVGALTLLLSIVAVAIYASAVNELTDRVDDAAAGKRNRAADGPRSVTALVAVAVSAGLAFAWFWRGDRPLLACYLAAWLAFALYSIPPVRLKKRGFAGVLCDAAGEQMFPALAAVFVACLGVRRVPGGAWVAAVAVWALAFGLRGIVWHQLKDLENDRAAGIRTFASRLPRGAALIGAFVVFPLELCAFALMLSQIGSPWPAAFLVLYAVYAVQSARRRQLAPVIVAPKPRSFIVLQDFYTDLFPVALLVASAVRDRRDALVLAAHLLLFPRPVIHAIRRLSASIANTVVNASEPHHGGLG